MLECCCGPLPGVGCCRRVWVHASRSSARAAHHPSCCEAGVWADARTSSSTVKQTGDGNVQQREQAWFSSPLSCGGARRLHLKPRLHYCRRLRTRAWTRRFPHHVLDWRHRLTPLFRCAPNESIHVGQAGPEEVPQPAASFSRIGARRPRLKTIMAPLFNVRATVVASIPTYIHIQTHIQTQSTNQSSAQTHIHTHLHTHADSGPSSAFSCGSCRPACSWARGWSSSCSRPAFVSVYIRWMYAVAATQRLD